MTVIITLEKAPAAADVGMELRRRGIDAVQVRFARQTVFVLAGAKIDPDQEQLAGIAGVERVMDAPGPYPLVHRAFHPEGTLVDWGDGVAIGGGRFGLIADLVDPAETGSLLPVARSLAESHGAALIARLPDSEGSHGERQRSAVIEALEEVRRTTGMRVGIEVTADGDLNDFAAVADLFRVAGERMQDYRLLQRVGAAGKPVVLVRALSATLEEWLLAAEYLAATGNDRVILCERGIRSFAPETGRVTLDLASVARLHEMTHLPVVVDPFPSCRSLSLGTRLARAAVAAGADGIVVPFSFHPKIGEPALGAAGMAHLAASLGPILAVEGKQMEKTSRFTAPV